GGRHHGHDPVALLQPNPAELHVLSHEPRLRKLHRRDEAQEFLDRETNPTPILLEPISQRRILEKLVDRSADQMGGGFRPGAQQQKDHRYHFVGADVPAFHFNAHKLGYQALSSMLAGEPQLLLEVAFHLPKAPDHAQDADSAG